MFQDMVKPVSSTGGGQKKVVTGTFTHTTGTTNSNYTINGLNKIDFIMAALGANTISTVVETNGATRLDSSSNTGYTCMSEIGDIDYKVAVYASNYLNNGLQKIDGNVVTFNHWNSTSQTVSYYAIGS